MVIMRSGRGDGYEHLPAKIEGGVVYFRELSLTLSFLVILIINVKCELSFLFIK